MDTFCDFALTVKATLKCLTPLPILMQNHAGGDSVIGLSILPPATPPVNKPIQRQVSADIKLNE